MNLCFVYYFYFALAFAEYIKHFYRKTDKNSRINEFIFDFSDILSRFLILIYYYL